MLKLGYEDTKGDFIKLFGPFFSNSAGLDSLEF